ncbi:hypothetical protein GF339_04885 [candidate division KSB3 bacterium]|uniref:Sulfotransferase domain-containing protein n=1 Tax=candidate division KSB3 bacterium TaxID=2044937 RepID=A0A9D5Q5H2_9BACT|nr:hypothetical protein [candidate division KSB3 bacterium]MBD3323896.1 hypothetical protein [candidate division KSB3 bacterium]
MRLCPICGMNCSENWKPMSRMPDFIGLGAQKAGTSWIYACLYEHPQICIPVKELHFFSRERNWTRGYAWYEACFEQCPPERKAGEFSTSYLADSRVPERIQQQYPAVKLLASLRHPIDRAYSNYVNDIKAGQVKPQTPFQDALKHHPEYLDQGRYAVQVKQYQQLFAPDQLLWLIYEDCLKQPQDFMRRIYRFLEVDPEFVPSMLHQRVNVSAIPRAVWLERGLTKLARCLHTSGLHRLWWLVKKTGAANTLRRLNAASSPKTVPSKTPPSWRAPLLEALEEDIDALEDILGRTLPEWRA